MTDVRIFSLYSGSTGNAFLVSVGDVDFLIDAGKSAKALCSAIRACGRDPDRVRAVFVTHEHSDHIQALPVFLKKHPVPVHLPLACAYKLAVHPSAEPLLVPHPPIHTEILDGIRVTSFPTPHDSQGSVGYRMEIPTAEGTLRVGLATDIGYVSPAIEENLFGCHAVILESNHDLEMLENGPYPYDLKKRIRSRRGHLSNPDCAEFAARLCSSGTQSILLAHLSMENNTPDTAYSECFSNLASDRVRLSVAHPDRITELDMEDLILC